MLCQKCCVFIGAPGRKAGTFKLGTMIDMLDMKASVQNLTPENFDLTSQ